MMNGETSQDIMTEGIFGGVDSDWDDDIEGDETETQSADAQKQPDQDAKKQDDTVADETSFLKVRYNKQDRVLSKAETVELAQKGLNYDHVYEELKSYREGTIGRALKAYADQAGMSVEEYARYMQEHAEAAAEKAAVEKLSEDHPDWPEDAVRELAKAQREGNKARAMSAEEEKRRREWAEARAAYPDVQPESIPKDVHDAIAGGMTPLEALREHEITDLRAKVAELTAKSEQLQQQHNNRARSVGSLRSQDKGTDDGFLSEFA